MAALDWFVLIGFLLLVSGVGLWFTKRASGSAEDFFVGGRSLPWWLAGTSVLATSFASDTPLHQTAMIRDQGLSGAWFYWNGILGHAIVAFFFARLWRRSGVVTDNEFIELRYAGRTAAVLRGGMALYKTLLLEILTIAWVTLGMVKVIKVIMGLPEFVDLPVVGPMRAELLVVALLLILTVVYGAASGIWGVVTTDVIEFAVATLGAVILAYVALDKAGGMSALQETLRADPKTTNAFDFVPSFDSDRVTFLTLGVWVGVQWWSDPGTDGSGQRAQRYLSCRDERHAIGAGLWGLAVQWLIRSWPWYLAALASLALYPDIKDGESVYPLMIAELLPVGLKGLMVASFISAFVSTMDSHYNLTASYMVNDVYRRFVVRDKAAKHYVTASRIATFGIALIAGSLALILPSVLDAFRLKMELMAGLGLVYVLRWFWWRINAKTELVALVVCVSCALFFRFWDVTAGAGADGSALRLLLIVCCVATATIATAWFTEPEPNEHLVNFFLKVRPPGLWGPIRKQIGRPIDDGFRWTIFRELGIALIFVFSGMIGIGKLLFGEFAVGTLLLLICVVTAHYLVRWATRQTVHVSEPS